MKKDIAVCGGRSCKCFGADRIMKKISEEVHLEPGEENEEYSLDWAGCMGYCGQGPNVRINKHHFIFSAEEDTIMDEIQKGGTNREGENTDVETEDKLLGI
ncbi:MAG: NAD(P)H-dependent oxidoreductase subunit E [Candidatus Magasanikbacteria bacterium]